MRAPSANSSLHRGATHCGGAKVAPAPSALQLYAAATSAVFDRYGSKWEVPGRKTASEPNAEASSPPKQASASFEYLLSHDTCRVGRADIRGC